jgi:hypothetical protein
MKESERDALRVIRITTDKKWLFNRLYKMYSQVPIYQLENSLQKLFHDLGFNKIR